MDLRDIGIKKDSICEAIVTTYHGDGTPNAAPMGVAGADKNRAILKVHKATDTHENILRSRCCVINIVFDPLLFLRCALYGRHKGSLEIEVGDVKQADFVEAPYLMDASAYVEAELESVEDFTKNDGHGRATGTWMRLKARNIWVLAPFPVAPNRGLFAAIELAIALSRKKTEDVHSLLAITKKTLPEDQSKRIEEFVKNYLSLKP